MIVSVVDYGRGNLFSICRALDALNIESKIVDTPDAILKADRLILPGVGAFAEAMATLKSKALDSAIVDYSKTGRPLLGICLGMQLMLNRSSEHGDTEGLGLIDGNVVELSRFAANGDTHKIPNVGWRETKCHFAQNLPDATKSMMDLHEFYFVHSFVAQPSNKENVMATASYNGIEFCAATIKENLVGVQFHPERSGERGVALLGRLLEI